MHYSNTVWLEIGGLAVEDSIAKINSAIVKSFYMGMVKVVNTTNPKIIRSRS